MAVDILQRCACAYIALNEITIKGDNEPNITWGILAEASDTTIQVGDWVKQDASTKKWSRIASTDDVSSSIVGLVRTIKKQITSTEYNTTGTPSGSLQNIADVSSADFNGAEIYVSGGDPIKASGTYIYVSGTRTAFAPATHTSLAGRLLCVPYVGIDGTSVGYYVSLHN